MSDQITYNDKADLIVDTTIDDKFKVSASDMNEIKNVVNNNAEEVCDITSLTTTDKTNVVNAVNELNAPEKWVSVGANAPTDGRRVLFKKGKNLFNKNIATIGGRLDASGGITTQSNGFYSNFIKVKANTTYTKNSPEADAYHRVCFYSNANASSFISKSESNTFTTPGNCKYLRFCGYDTEIDTTMLEKGSSATTYEPYIELSINVDEEEWYSKPKILWGSSTGVTSGSITLNESIENYSYIEVEYSINTYSSFRGVARLTKNSSTSTAGSLVAEFGNGTANGIICWAARIVINNANATIERNYCLNFTSSGNTALSDNYISVLKILGYKE